MDPAARPLLQRTVNRWTLEPVIFLIPFLLIAIVLGTVLLAMLASGNVAGFAAAVLLVAVIIVLSVLGLLKKR